VNSKFDDNTGFSELERRESTYAKALKEKIGKKAAGVFLWVHLVVNSLLAGLMNGDRVSDLERRLELLPPDLDKLYQKMLGSVDPFYHSHASQLFQLVRAAFKPPTLLVLSYADEELNFPFKSKVHPLSKEDIILRADTMRRRLNSRCKGLLEIASTKSATTTQDVDDLSGSANLPREFHLDTGKFFSLNDHLRPQRSNISTELSKTS